ncbi:hypothetical protein RNJ44_00247 [Nakaseomyces bracarensis]|uniref:Uncharacterized protein n=1 Tax=Nakaseomyces bracarensis TaxID=273131 RepID=A0ABR4NTA9_9SACH
MENPRRLSREQIINEMEKEQDAIVVKLLKEIEALKVENARLRQRLSVYTDEVTPGRKRAGSTSTANSIATNSAILTDDEDDEEHGQKRDSFLRIPTSPSHSRQASISSSSSSSNRRPSLVVKEQRQLELLEFKKRAAAAARKK